MKADQYSLAFFSFCCFFFLNIYQLSIQKVIAGHYHSAPLRSGHQYPKAQCKCQNVDGLSGCSGHKNEQQLQYSCWKELLWVTTIYAGFRTKTVVQYELQTGRMLHIKEISYCSRIKNLQSRCTALYCSGPDMNLDIT